MQCCKMNKCCRQPTLKSIRKRRRQTKFGMEKLTVQQVHRLRKAQEELIFTKNTYLEFYRKMTKHAYTTDLKNLIRGEFNRVNVELKIPQLPPEISIEKEYTPMLQLDKMMELYDLVSQSDL